MRLLLLSVCFMLCLQSCDDGDIVVSNFEFDDATLEWCDDFEFVFFKIQPDSNESIALAFSTDEDFLNETGQIQIDLSGNDQVVYRRFNSEVTSDYFCNPIPPTSPIPSEELVSTTGLITVTTTAIEEDQDGIESSIEDSTGVLDTDGDGLIDIIDDDDDGDNIPTALEGIAFNNDGTINVELSRDTDGDGILDYLDEDDDGDGILTRNEDANGNLNPTDDNTDPSNLGLDDYLNPAIANETIINAYRQHIYSLADIVLTIDMELLSFLDENNEPAITLQSSLFLGEFNDLEDTTILFTPSFN